MQPPSAIDKLPIRIFNGGDVLVEEGDSGSAMYFLVHGTVEVSKGGQTITQVRERGAMFGEMSVLLACPHTASVRAVDRVECRVVDHASDFLPANPDVVHYICWVLARRLDSLNRYLVDLKSQFGDRADHLGMVDEVLGAIMNRQPRDIARQTDAGA